MKTQNIQTLVIQFQNEISMREIPLFRGCVIHAMENANLLFHNHLDDDGLRYRYPLIQYKRINGRAALVCIGEGTEVIGEFFNCGDFSFQLGQRVVEMEIERVEAKHTLLQVWNTDFSYAARKWLPLSSENYRTYLSLEGMADRCAFLQKILIGNILSFCKGLDVTVEKEIKCVITDILDSNSYIHKGVRMMGFDVAFKSNVSLPDFIGLGKGVSMGFGMVVKINK